MFWIGVLSCWTVMSVLLMLADNRDWVAIWALPCGIILCFPALVILHTYQCSRCGKVKRTYKLLS